MESVHCCVVMLSLASWKANTVGDLKYETAMFTKAGVPNVTTLLETRTTVRVSEVSVVEV